MQHDRVIIGTGPVGLAAAAHAQRRGRTLPSSTPVPRPAPQCPRGAHVQLLSPWSELVDPVPQELLTAGGWVSPDPALNPAGPDWVNDYLKPLAEVLAKRVRSGRAVDRRVQ